MCECDPFLSSQSAACRRMLQERVTARVSSLGRVVVGVSLGVCKRTEKLDPLQAAENIVEVCRHFRDQVRATPRAAVISNPALCQSVPVFAVSALPVLVAEPRLTAYSACWSSALNLHLAALCHASNTPYLPLHHCLHSEV